MEHKNSNKQRKNSKFRNLFTKRGFFKSLGFGAFVAALVVGTMGVTTNGFGSKKDDKKELQTSTKIEDSHEYYTHDEIRQKVIANAIDTSKIGYVLNNIDAEIIVPLETGDEYKRPQLDENGNQIEVFNERTNQWEKQWEIGREKVDQIIKIDHGRGKIRMPGLLTDAYCKFDIPLSYMNKVMVNIQTIFYDQAFYCEYQGNESEYLHDTEVWHGREQDLGECLPWKNIKFRMPTRIGPPVELVDVDGEVRYVNEPSDLQKILSHLVNYTVQCGLISSEKISNLLKGGEDKEDGTMSSILKPKNYVTPNYSLDAQKIIDSLLAMEVEYNAEEQIYNYFVNIPVVVKEETEVLTKNFVLRLGSDANFNLTNFDFPYDRGGSSLTYFQLPTGDMKLKISAQMSAEEVLVESLSEEQINGYQPLVDSLGLFDSIFKFVAQPKLKYKTDITIDHVVNGPVYSNIKNGNGDIVDYYDPNENIEWYKSQGIDTGIFRKGKENPLNIIETIYLKAVGATHLGNGWNFSDITGTVPTEMGYDIQLGIKEDKVDSLGNVETDAEGNPIRKDTLAHRLLYSWDANADGGKGMNYFEYVDVAKYKANYVDFNKILGQVLNLYAKYFNNSTDVEVTEKAKQDFWKYVDALGESKLRRTLGLLVDDAWGILKDSDVASSLEEGHVRNLTNLVTNFEIYDDGAGGITVIDFAPIGLTGKFILEAKTKSVDGYLDKDGNPTALTADHKNMNDKFSWRLEGIKIGGFIINGTIDFISCNEDTTFFLDNYIKVYEDFNGEPYQPITYFNDVMNQVLTFNEKRQVAFDLHVSAWEREGKQHKAGMDLKTKVAIDFDYEDPVTKLKSTIGTAGLSLVKVSPLYASSDLVNGRSGKRAQEFNVDVDFLEKRKKVQKKDATGQPMYDPVTGEPVYEINPVTGQPLELIDSENSNVFLRVGSTTTKRRAGALNNTYGYSSPSRPYEDMLGSTADHPIEGWASIQAYVDLFNLCKSVLQDTPDARFSKFLSMLSTDVNAITALNTVLDKVKNGNMLTPLVQTKLISDVTVNSEEHSLSIKINKDIAGGKLATDPTIKVTTVKHKFETPEEEAKYKEKHPDHEARDISGIIVDAQLANNESADGAFSFDGLAIKLEMTILDYEAVDSYGHKINNVQDNYKFKGPNGHNIKNPAYIDFTSVEKITQSALNTAWLGSGARYFNTDNGVKLMATSRNDQQVIGNGSLRDVKPMPLSTPGFEIGPATYHIRLRFSDLGGQFFFTFGFEHLTMDFWIQMDGEKLRALAIINMPLQQGFNDKLLRPTYYGASTTGSDDKFVKSMILYEVGYTPKEDWTEIDKGLNRDTGKVYIYRDYRETNAYDKHKVNDYRVVTGYFFRRHMQEWIQFYILGDHYPNGGLAGQRDPFEAKPVYPDDGELEGKAMTDILNANFYPEDILTDYSSSYVPGSDFEKINKTTWNMKLNYHDMINFDLGSLKTGWRNDSKQREDKPVNITLTGINSYLKKARFTCTDLHPLKVILSYAYFHFDGTADLYNLTESGVYTDCWQQKAKEQFVFTSLKTGNKTIQDIFDQTKQYCDSHFVMTPIPYCDYNNSTKKFVRNFYPDDPDRNGFGWQLKNGVPTKVGGQYKIWDHAASWSGHDAKNTVHY